MQTTEYRGRVFVDLPGLRRVRKSQGLSLRKLAEEAGMSYVHISRLERGEHHATIDTAKKLAKALRTHLNELIVEQEERKE